MFEGVLQTHLVLKQPFNLEMMTQLQLLWNPYENNIGYSNIATEHYWGENK